MGSVLGDLLKIVTGTSNALKGKGYVSNDFDPTPIKNRPQDGCMKYLIEGTAQKHGNHLQEKFVVFAHSGVISVSVERNSSNNVIFPTFSLQSGASSPKMH